MIDHFGFIVRDLTAARQIYDATVRPIGQTSIDDGPDSKNLRLNPSGAPIPFLFIGVGRPTFWTNAHGPSQSPIHVGFKAPDKAAVDAFYQAGLAAGGRDNGAPGPRGPEGFGYYGAYLIDPDGNNIEAGVRG